MSDEQPPQAPRPRLVLPTSGDASKPRTRLIAPAVTEPEYAPEPTAEEPLPIEEPAESESVAEALPHVSPLSPPAPAADSAAEAEEDDLGGAEQGEFTVINEDTGETHTVPVRVSSMAPPSAATETPEPEPAPEPEPIAVEPEPEPEPEPVYEQPDYGGYASAEEQQAAIDYEQAQQQAYYEQQAQPATPVMAVPALAYQQPAPRQQFQQPPPPYPQQQHYAPPQQHYAPHPHPGYPPAQGGYPYPMIKPTRNVPSWALLLIGLLVGFIIALVLFKFTEFGPMLRPPESMIKKN